MTATIHIDKKRAQKLLTEVVKKRGADEIFAQCQYADGYKPGCIVGEALFIAGVPVKQLELMDDPGEGQAISLLDTEEFGFSLTPGARQVLQRAQGRVDAGSTFGEAVKAARQV